MDTPVPPEPGRFRGRILFRTTIQSWLVVVLALGLFLAFFIPYQKAVLIRRLDSTARIICSSIQQVTINSILLEDYSTVVDHCLTVVNDRELVQYLVITRSDGFSLIHTNSGWRRDQLDDTWQIGKDLEHAGFRMNPFGEEEIYHCTRPITLSGLGWGWTHVGLDLDHYHTNLSAIYLRSGLIAGLCMLGALGLSHLFARRVSDPIQQLSDAVHRVADGDLDARAQVRTGDELERLAGSFNLMTESLRRSQDELEVRVDQRTVELSRSNDQLKMEIENRERAEVDRIQLEEQLRQLQKMKAVGEISAGIAHNFNNMLVVILGNLEMAKTGAPSRIRKYLEDAETASQTAADMVKELMLFSRKAEIRRVPLDLWDVVNEAVQICRNTFDRRIEITLEGDDIPSVLGDSGQLQQILLNLCINAIDAIESMPNLPRRAGIAIRLEEVNISAEEAENRPESRAGDFVRVSVSDNGPGMDEEIGKHIFEPFFTTKEVGKGTGLGLATVYGILQRHEGWIELESWPDVGTTFSFYLALAGSRASGETSLEEEGPDGDGETILVIEDEEGVRNTLEIMLTEKGCHVITGVDGVDGLNLFRREQESISLVILDLSMPRLSGREVLAQMRAFDKRTKVIIYTGYAAGGADIPGAAAVLQKPARRAEMLYTIHSVLSDNGSAAT